MSNTVTQFKAALFDLDGTLFDTEGQYSIFWSRIGAQYHPEIPHFEQIIKGTTLVSILDHYFPVPAVRDQVVLGINDWESQMRYEFFPGAEAFLQDLRSHGVKTAIVTSSNQEKMANVGHQLPCFNDLFDAVLTAEDFARSKPHPDCYLKGAARLGVAPHECVVFEDAFTGLAAGMSAQMFTIGITSCNPREAIQDKCSHVIDTFEFLSYNKLLHILGL